MTASRLRFLVPLLLLVFASCSDDDPVVTKSNHSAPAPEFVTSWGSLGTGEGEFDGPAGVACDYDGDVYVVDMMNSRIQKFDGDGTFLDEWGDEGRGATQFRNPWGVAVVGAKIYVADSDNDRIQIFNIEFDPEYAGEWGRSGLGDGEFDGPLSITADSRPGDWDSGTRFYVADAINNRIQVMNYGGFIDKWGSRGSADGQFTGPVDVACDDDGNVYVVDSLNERVQKFTGDGDFITKWGEYGDGDGQFDGPGGIATDDEGYVYVTDRWNHRVQKFKSDGTFVTKWGSEGTGDGQFSSPIGIAWNEQNGAIFVVDLNRVQKFK